MRTRKEFLEALQQGAASIEVAGECIQGDDLSGMVGAVARVIGGARTVAVVAYPTVDTLIAISGILLSGAAAVPINASASVQEREHILRDCAPDLVLDHVDRKRRCALPQDLTADDRPALILYTSGSTGAPKGTVIPRRAIASNLDTLAHLWEWSPADTLAHALPLFHAHGLVFGALGPLRIGSRLVHTGDHFEPVEKATIYFGSSTFWASLKSRDVEMMRDARLLVSGGARLAAETSNRVARLNGHRILNRYATTEALVITSPGLHEVWSSSSVGHPLPGVEVRIANPAEDGIGSIDVRGNNLFLGYLGREDSLLSDGWYQTNDLGRWNDRGDLELVGRRDTDLFKIAGYRVGAGEVEDALLSYPGVSEAAVVGIPDGLLGHRLEAWVACSTSVDKLQLSMHVADRLAPYKRPSHIHMVDGLPRNPVGKIQKYKLLYDARVGDSCTSSPVSHRQK